MTPVKQSELHDAVTVGNCFQACIASLRDLPLSAVPHFCNDFARDQQRFPWNMHEWLGERGLVYIEFTVEEARTASSNWWGHHLICGQSPRGKFLHSVIGFNGDPIFDVHPSNQMLLPQEVRPWMYSFIFPRR